MTSSSDPGVARLVESSDPSVRYLTLTEVLRERRSAPHVAAARRAIPGGPKVRALLAGQKRDGGFGVNIYAKWGGGFWRLVALAELGMPPGRSARPRGGWNCDRTPEATHSSFHETHGPLWGLAEFHRVTGDSRARRVAKKAAEFVLWHHVFLSEETGRVIREDWLRLRFPPYWHYDVLQGLWVLSRAGKLDDPRAKVALDVLLKKRRADGMWRADGYHWKPPDSDGSNVEVVDWGRRGPSEWVTLRALRVLASVGGRGV